MNPVLAEFVLGDLLQENLGTSAIGWQQALIATGGDAVADVTDVEGNEHAPAKLGGPAECVRGTGRRVCDPRDLAARVDRVRPG